MSEEDEERDREEKRTRGERERLEVFTLFFTLAFFALQLHVFEMDRLQRLLGQAGGASGPGGDVPQVDTAEQIYISSLALLKMLKHGELRESTETENGHRSIDGRGVVFLISSLSLL